MRDLDAESRQAWDEYGLDPLGADTPPWTQVVGRRVHLVGYDWHNSEHHVIEGPWAVDIDHLPGPLGKAARGDVLLYVGRAEGTRDVLVWPPALVIHAGRSADGEQRVITLTHDGLAPLSRRTLTPALRARLDRPPAVLSPTIRDKVLALWGLDVLCPECGAPGTPVQFGFPVLAVRAEVGGAASLPLPPPGHIGCLPPEDGHRWECACGWQWPGNDPIVESVWEIFDLHGCEDDDEFESGLQEEVEDDGISVRFNDDDAEELRIGFRGHKRAVQFPFYMSEFWDTVLMVRADAGVTQGWMPPMYAG